jgi:hypothetical protein
MVTRRAAVLPDDRRVLHLAQVFLRQQAHPVNQASLAMGFSLFVPSVAFEPPLNQTIDQLLGHLFYAAPYAVLDEALQQSIFRQQVASGFYARAPDEIKTNTVAVAAASWSESALFSINLCAQQQKGRSVWLRHRLLQLPPRQGGKGASSNEDTDSGRDAHRRCAENGISTPGLASDSVYLQTSFPIRKQSHRYSGGLIFAEKSSIQAAERERSRERRISTPLEHADSSQWLHRESERGAAQRGSGGKETMDSKARSRAPVQKGKTPVQSRRRRRRAQGSEPSPAGAKGAGIGGENRRGGRAGGYWPFAWPEAELPRGSTMDIVLERELSLDASQIQFTNLGQAQPITPPPTRQQ